MNNDPIRIYIICPVRHLTEDVKSRIDVFVGNLEATNTIVRLPYRDCDQSGDGMTITETHEQDIIWADEIWIWWTPQSEGSLWDLAQARMARHFLPNKKIFLINDEDVQKTPEKSYQNVLLKTLDNEESYQKFNKEESCRKS